jgi:hypothetical protein
MIPGGWLGLLVVGIILGALGQGARTIVELKKLNDHQTQPTNCLCNGVWLLISFAIGGVAGAFAAITVLPDTGQISQEQLLGIATAGYAGTDFIEGFVGQLSGGTAAVASPSVPATSSSDDAVG